MCCVWRARVFAQRMGILFLFQQAGLTTAYNLNYLINTKIYPFFHALNLTYTNSYIHIYAHTQIHSHLHPYCRDYQENYNKQETEWQR